MKILLRLIKIFYLKIFFCVMFSSIWLFSQSYIVSLENGKQISSRTFEFDIYIEASNLLLFAYQCALDYNSNDSTELIYQDSTCQIKNKPTINSIGNYTYDEFIKFAYASNVETDTINGKTRLGHFYIVGTPSINGSLLNLKWVTNGILRTIFLKTENGQIIDVTSQGTFRNLDVIISSIDDKIPIDTVKSNSIVKNKCGKIDTSFIIIIIFFFVKRFNFLKRNNK